MRSPCPSRYVRYHLRSPFSSTCKKPGLLAHGLTRGSGAATTRVFPANTSRRETYVDTYVNPQTLRTNLLTQPPRPASSSKLLAKPPLMKLHLRSILFRDRISREALRFLDPSSFLFLHHPAGPERERERESGLFNLSDTRFH